MLVAGTAALAFWSGGYFEDARAIAGVVAWTLAAILALVLPRERLVPRPAGAVALTGLALLTAWTALAESWAPLPELAADDLERLVLYTGAFVAALLAFSEPAARRWLEPGIALLALVVVGYGLAGRLLPGVVDLDSSATAEGRLEQPLTYWNAMGALAAIGAVLAARVAGDPARPRLRVAAGALAPLLGLGLYLSFSRGALLAAVFGLAVLLCLVPRRSQLAAAAVAAAGGGALALLATRFPTVESLASGGDPEREGLEMLLLTVLVCGLAGFGTWLAVRRAGMPAGAPVSPRARRAVAAIVVVALLIPVIGAPLAFEAGDAPERGADAGRFTSVGSNRYAYWRIALESVPDRPLKGVGPGGYRVLWMQERPIDEAARDAHSLQLETAAELGLPGLGFLALFAGATFAAAAAALRRGPRVAGLVAALVAWAVSASVDWMWEMPTLGLVGLLLSAALVSESGATPASEAAD